MSTYHQPNPEQLEHAAEPLRNRRQVVFNAFLLLGEALAAMGITEDTPHLETYFEVPAKPAEVRQPVAPSPAMAPVEVAKETTATPPTASAEDRAAQARAQISQLPATGANPAVEPNRELTNV